MAGQRGKEQPMAHDPSTTPKMPDGLTFVRVTPEFTSDTLPAGLRRAHRVAPGAWGRLRVLEGTVRFVFENADSEHGAAGTHELAQDESIDIPPDVPHRVEPMSGCRLTVEFWAPTGGGG
jgi:tellurite resistance-related uncharacterized protein